jgi:CRP/FNR family transcriptional regulator
MIMGIDMFTDSAVIRRPVMITASGRHGSRCDDCEARHSGMCDALSDEDLSLLSHSAQHVAVAAGKLFIEEGDQSPYFYNITHGNVRVFRLLPDGRRHITGFMSGGQFLGLAETGTYAFNAEAMDEVHLCRFNRVALNGLFSEFPALERRLLNISAHELTAAHEQMLLLARKTAAERIASYLVNLALRHEGCVNGMLPAGALALDLPVSRSDLADYLGLTIETVSRSFANLKKTGLIDFHNAHAVTLLKPRQLAAVGNGAA